MNKILNVKTLCVAFAMCAGYASAQVAELTPLPGATPPGQMQAEQKAAEDFSVVKSSAKAAQETVLQQPLEAPAVVGTDLKGLVEKILQTPDDGARYLQLSSFVKAHGPWIPLQSESGIAKVHLVSYLLQIDHESDAVALLKNKDVAGWLSYSFMGGVANDFLFALDAGHVSYIAALCLVSPEGINTPFPVSADGSSVLPLSVLASAKYKSKPYYESVIRTLLKHGANPVQPMPNGLTPMTIASSESNAQFLRIVQAFQSENAGRDVGLLENTPLTSVQLVEQQRITDSLLEKSMDERKSAYGFKRLHEMWLQMIMNGLNIPANLLYDTLVTFPEFSVDKKNDIGMNGLMAAAMSNLYGGNVDYARVLIERGADPKQIIELVSDNPAEKPIKSNLIQSALPNDNFKIVALLITKNVDFVISPDVENVKSADSEDALILTEAVGLQAYRSSYIIWQALSQHLEKMEGVAPVKP